MQPLDAPQNPNAAAQDVAPQLCAAGPSVACTAQAADTQEGQKIQTGPTADAATT
ncbi:MAG: hypothetical protein AB8B71_08770 [Paracoccaceae bacterium]